MLKIYTDNTFLTEKNRSHVFPLLFDLHYLNSNSCEDYFEIVDDPHQCNVIILPISLNRLYTLKNGTLLTNFVKLGKAVNKPLWLYSAGDCGISYNASIAYNFRLSGRHSRMTDYNIIMPVFISDPYIFLNTEPKYIDKYNRPQIGFVGQAHNSIIQKVIFLITWSIKLILVKFKALDRPDFFNPPFERWRILNRIKTSNEIDSNFIFNKDYRGGVTNEKERFLSQLVFYQNIEANAYTICIRGAGNFSVRFYETLAMGRIPVVVDSDARLPLADKINWKNHIVNVKPDSVVTDLILFHKSISKSEFIQMQKANRLLWRNYLTRVNFFRAIAENIS